MASDVAKFKLWPQLYSRLPKFVEKHLPLHLTLSSATRFILTSEKPKSILTSVSLMTETRVAEVTCMSGTWHRPTKSSYTLRSSSTHRKHRTSCSCQIGSGIPRSIFWGASIARTQLCRITRVYISHGDHLRALRNSIVAHLESRKVLLTVQAIAHFAWWPRGLPGITEAPLATRLICLYIHQPLWNIMLSS